MMHELCFIAAGEYSNLFLEVNYAPESDEVWSWKEDRLKLFCMTTAVHNGAMVTRDGYMALALHSGNDLYEGGCWLMVDNPAEPARMAVVDELPAHRDWKPYTAADMLYDYLQPWWDQVGSAKYAMSSAASTLLGQMAWLTAGPWERLHLDYGPHSEGGHVQGTADGLEFSLITMRVTALDGSKFWLTRNGPVMKLDRELREEMQSSSLGDQELFEMDALGTA